MVEGALLGVTNNSGSGLRLHRHNYFLLDDGDGMAPTNVAEGVYLVALQLDMPGYGITKPIFVVPGSYGLVSTSLPTLETAVAWVEENAGMLILDGDYDFDGDVDSGDYSTWRSQHGSAGPFPINGDYADGNRDGVVDAADYVVWRKNRTAASGTALVSSALASVPEPASLAIVSWAGLAWLVRTRRPASRQCPAHQKSA
jgi:hypothetical protein